MTTRQVIRRKVTLQMTEPVGMTVPGELTYDPDHPVAVTLLLHDTSHDEKVRWVFARELLREGVIQPAGDGDITIAPLHAVGEPDIIEVALRGFDDDGDPGLAAVTMPRGVALRFLRRSYMEVPASVESLLLEPVIDDLITQIMGNAEDAM